MRGLLQPSNAITWNKSCNLREYSWKRKQLANQKAEIIATKRVKAQMFQEESWKSKEALKIVQWGNQGQFRSNNHSCNETQLTN